MYDFDKVVNRRDTNSYKWDVPEGQLPMWVADMDFETAPAVKQAIKKRAEHGVFGYASTPDEWYSAYQSWWNRRHGFKIEKEWLLFCTGIVPAISSIVRKVTNVAENVIVITPAYNIFFNSIYNNGRNIIECQLDYEDGEYSLDLNKLEDLCADPQSTLLILCNPHNPVGKIWDKQTLSKIGDICARNNVIVLSDEIHCDITVPGREYVPFASVSEVCRDNSIVCISPTKTFNIAGIQTAAICVPEKKLRHKVWRGINTDEVAEGNVFAYEAAVAAFNESEDWVNELNEYLAANRKYAEQYINEKIDGLIAIHGEATYLLWIDCGQVTQDSKDFSRFLKNKAGLFLSVGDIYRGNGNTFMRMNLACTRKNLEEGLKRLEKGVSEYKMQ